MILGYNNLYLCTNAEKINARQRTTYAVSSEIDGVVYGIYYRGPTFNRMRGLFIISGLAYICKSKGFSLDSFI